MWIQRLELRRGKQVHVRLSDDARDCVVYLGWPSPDSETEIDPHGTGFLIGHGGLVYLVTAAHVARDLTEVPFGIRLNAKAGGSSILRIEDGKWWRHPEDELVDVAVMPFQVPSWAKASDWSTRYFATMFKLESKGIGPGDVACIVGVFSPLHGAKENLLFVHSGHLALMPSERIPARDWRAPDSNAAPAIEIEGYLVEAHTLPGSSGSPVFVRRTLATKQLIPELDINPLKVWWHGTAWLLGLWQGAWFGEPADVLRVPHGERLKVPLGVGVVVPAIKILEVLEHPELVAMRAPANAR